MDQLLLEKKAQFGLGLIGVVTPDMKEQNWHPDPGFEEPWREFKAATDWKALGEEKPYVSNLLSGPEQDVVIAVLAVDKAKTGFLVLGEGLGPGMLAKMDRVVGGVEEYKKLRALKSP